MSEVEIIHHADPDSIFFLRIHTISLDSFKIFGTIAIIALLVLIPVNTSGDISSFLECDLLLSNIDKLSITNVHAKSNQLYTMQKNTIDMNCPTEMNFSMSMAKFGEIFGRYITYLPPVFFYSAMHIFFRLTFFTLDFPWSPVMWHWVDIDILFCK